MLAQMILKKLAMDDSNHLVLHLDAGLVGHVPEGGPPGVGRDGAEELRVGLQVGPNLRQQSFARQHLAFQAILPLVASFSHKQTP